MSSKAENPAKDGKKPPQVPPRRTVGAAVRKQPPNATAPAAPTATSSAGSFAAKLFKKCKSATFQIDGQTYTIGKSN